VCRDHDPDTVPLVIACQRSAMSSGEAGVDPRSMLSLRSHQDAEKRPPAAFNTAPDISHADESRNATPERPQFAHSSVPHVWHSRPHEMERCIDANGDHSVSSGGIGIFEPRRDNQTRIVHQRFNPTEPTGGELDNPHAWRGSFEVFIARYSNIALRGNLCGNPHLPPTGRTRSRPMPLRVVHDHRGPARDN
jgi:hypothetical protein